MKTSIKAAAFLLPFFVATAFAAPPSKQVRVPKPSEQKTKQAAPLCGICSKLAAQTTPAAASVGSRIYDPLLSCHRQIRYTPRAGGKGNSSETVCVCS